MTPEQTDELRKIASQLGSEELDLLERVFGFAKGLVERARLEALEEAAKKWTRSSSHPLFVREPRRSDSKITPKQQRAITARKL